MSHRLSQRKLRQEAMAAPLGTFDGDMALAIDCGTAACRRDRAYMLSDLAGVHGRTVPLAQALARLRCQECGQGIADAALARVGRGGRLGRVLAVWGRGSE